MLGSRPRAMVSIAWRELLTHRSRTVFAIIGIAVAVLAVTMLMSVSAGVLATGEEQFEAADREIWVSGGPVEVDPGEIGGFRNPVVDAHNVSAAIDGHEDVRDATPLAFQAVYVSADGEEFETIVGSGVPGMGGAISLDEGDGFSGSDTHRSGGTYDGPMTHEVVIDPAIADSFDVGVGDTLFIGGTIGGAQRNEFEIVGISSTMGEMMGAETVSIRLSELQTLTASEYEDRATLIVVALEDGVDAEEVREELQAEHPDYDVRTSGQQLEAIVQRQAVVIAGGASLTGIAVIAGIVFSMNLFVSMMYQQRRTFAIIGAIGGHRSSILIIGVVQAILISLIGGLLGLLLTPVMAGGLETVVLALTGFDGLVRVPREAYIIGGGIAGMCSILGAVVGAWRVHRFNDITTLSSS